MSRPTPTDGAIAHTARGFAIYAEFVDLYYSTVRVQFSSRAFHPACWVWIRRCTDPGVPPGAAVDKDGSGHLTVPQAIQLRDALSAFIADAERFTEQGLYDPEESEGRPAAGPSPEAS